MFAEDMWDLSAESSVLYEAYIYRLSHDRRSPMKTRPQIDLSPFLSSQPLDTLT